LNFERRRGRRGIGGMGVGNKGMFIYLFGYSSPFGLPYLFERLLAN
jgi:hypothetical protein